MQRQSLLAAALIAMAGVAAYHNSLSGPFIYDDLESIVQNRTIHQLWPIGEVLSPPRNGETVTGRPLLNLSLAINYALAAEDVGGYHVVNLVIHIAAALLLFGILRQTFLLPALRDRFGRAATWLALASALLWLLHPLQTESVTYIIQRAESLVGLFFLLTLYCTIRGATGTVPFFAAQNPALPSRTSGEKGDCPPLPALLPAQIAAGETPALHGKGEKGNSPPLCSRRCSWLWYAAAILSCLLGMASKENMVTAPLLVLLYDCTFLAGSFEEAWRRRGAFYLGLATTWVPSAYLVLSSSIVGRPPQIDSWSYARSQPGAILHYLEMSAWPHRLSLEYGWPVASTVGEILPGVLVVGVLVAATLWGLKRRQAWGFLGAWFLLTLAPTSSILPITQLACDHRMYLPLAAEAVLAVAGGYVLWSQLMPQPPGAGRAATVVRWAVPAIVLATALSALGFATVARNRDYASAVAIWEDAVRKCPDSHVAQYNLAGVLLGLGRADEAVAPFNAALRLKPRWANAHNNLGVALASLKRSSEAIEQYDQALRLKPDDPQIHNNLGLVQQAAGNDDEAIFHYQWALRLRPEYPAAHNNLGSALASSGRIDEAIEHYKLAVRLQPDYVEAYNNLGKALAAQNRTREAIQQYRQALVLNPDFLPALNNLAWLLATVEPIRGGDPAAAVPMAERLCELDGRRHPQPLDTLAAAYAAAGRFADAVINAERALRLAESSGQSALAKDIQSRLELYRAGRPYREAPRSPR